MEQLWLFCFVRGTRNSMNALIWGREQRKIYFIVYDRQATSILQIIAAFYILPAGQYSACKISFLLPSYDLKKVTKRAASFTPVSRKWEKRRSSITQTIVFYCYIFLFMHNSL